MFYKCPPIVVGRCLLDKVIHPLSVVRLQIRRVSDLLAQLTYIVQNNAINFALCHKFPGPVSQRQCRINGSVSVIRPRERERDGQICEEQNLGNDLAIWTRSDRDNTYLTPVWEAFGGGDKVDHLYSEFWQKRTDCLWLRWPLDALRFAGCFRLIFINEICKLISANSQSGRGIDPLVVGSSIHLHTRYTQQTLNLESSSSHKSSVSAPHRPSKSLFVALCLYLLAAHSALISMVDGVFVYSIELLPEEAAAAALAKNTLTANLINNTAALRFPQSPAA